MPNMIRLGVEGDLQELSMFGRTYAERWIDGLNRTERAADKTLRVDVIATKKGFLLGYDIADQAVVDRLNYLFDLQSELILEVTHMTEVKTYNVWMSPFEQERILAVWGGLWGGTSIELVQI